VRALIVVLWRGGLGVGEHDLDRSSAPIVMVWPSPWPSSPTRVEPGSLPESCRLRADASRTISLQLPLAFAERAH